MDSNSHESTQRIQSDSDGEYTSDGGESCVSSPHVLSEDVDSDSSDNPCLSVHLSRSGEISGNVTDGGACNPVSSSPGPLVPLGGYVSTSTAHASKMASGQQVIELVEDIVKREHKPCYDASVETRGTSQNDVKEVHVHLTQTNIHNPAAVTFGGQVVVGPSKDEPEATQGPKVKSPSDMQKLRAETERTFEKWTEGMVKTRGTKTVLDMISLGRTWITITGSPGEGKTTAGYLVLRHLHKAGRQVFDIKTPEDYFKIKEVKQPVVMLNDLFGSLHFDQGKVKKWEAVLNDILAVKEHRREEELKCRDRRQAQFTVLLISRSSVLKAASYHLGRFKDLILKEDNVVDFTHGIDIAEDERMKIWKFVSEGYSFDISDKVIKEVCQMSLPHGFPHCCRLFAHLHSKNKSLNMKSFFSKPIEFLNQTMESLMMDEITGPLLRDMLSNDGSLNLDSVTNEEKRFQYKSAVDMLGGTYLSLDRGTVTFHHPSVYDSAAFVVCKNEPVFVIQNCSLSFLNDRVRLRGLGEGKRNDGRHTVTIDSNHIPIFLHRLKGEFENGNISDTLSHAAFDDDDFVAMFFQNIVVPKKDMSLLRYVTNRLFKGKDEGRDHVRRLIETRDQTSKDSFLYLLTKGKSDSILRYVRQSVQLSKEEQKETLFGICAHGSVTAMEHFLVNYRNFNLNVKNEFLETPLLVASTKCSGKIVKLLLERGADISIKDQKGNSVLHNICRHGLDGNVDVVKLLTEKGAEVNQGCGEYPHLPLHIASREGHKDIVSWLVQSGANINMGDRNGDTPLIHACEMSHVGVLTTLIDRGADMNITGCAGNTPLHNACYWGNVSVLTVLLDRGAHINMINTVGDTPLHSACYGGFVDVVTVLLERGADVNRMGADGDFPLHKASYGVHADIVRALLDRGADMQQFDGTGNTALHNVCYLGHIDILPILLAKGSDINMKNKLDDTLLHSATCGGHLDILTFLLDGGAEINKTGSEWDSPLHRACFSGDVNVVNLLLDRHADVNQTNIDGDTPLHKACYSGHMDIVNHLLGGGADVNKANRNGDTSLHTALQQTHVDILITLLHNGADIHKLDSSGNTPLHGASLKGHDGLVALLLEKEPDINMSNIVGETCLHNACFHGHLSVVKLLLDKGANINMQGDDGGTSLHRACYGGHIDVVRVLLDRGADMNMMNNEGYTPFQIARFWGHEDVIRLLFEEGADVCEPHW